MNTHVQDILFTYEYRATLDGPDNWASVWVFYDKFAHMFALFARIGVMFRFGIMWDGMIGSFKVPEVAKINTITYYYYTHKHIIRYVHHLNFLVRLFLCTTTPYYTMLRDLKWSSTHWDSKGFIGIQNI